MKLREFAVTFRTANPDATVAQVKAAAEASPLVNPDELLIVNGKPTVVASELHKLEIPSQAPEESRLQAKAAPPTTRRRRSTPAPA